MLLVLRGTPAAVDEELDPVARGISCSLAQGTEEGWIKVGYGWKIVIEARRAVGDRTVSLAKRTTLFAGKDEGTVRLAKRTTVLAGKDEVTLRLARRTTVLAAKTTVLTAKDVGG